MILAMRVFSSDSAQRYVGPFLQLAVDDALTSAGFVPKVMAFQSYYVFNTSKMEDLRVGAAILKEALDRETEKEERAQRGKEEQKAVAAAAAQNVRLCVI